MGKRRNVFFYAAMSLLCMVMFSMGIRQAQAASGGKITVSVERFSLGQGYLIEPTEISFTQGENFAQVFDRLMKQKGFTYRYNGRLTDGFYLESIDNADTGVLNIPRCIQNMPSVPNWDGTKVAPPTNENHTGNLEFPALGEFAYSKQSGWYYFVNNIAPGVGFSGTTVSNGDVIRVQFTVYGLGADLGAGYGESAQALKLPNRDAVTRKLAVMNGRPDSLKNAKWKKAYQDALAAAANLDSTPAQITAAERALPTQTKIDQWLKQQADSKKYTPKKMTLKTVKKSGTRKMKLTWKKVSSCSGYQIYMSVKKKSGYKKIKTVTQKKVTSYTKTKLKKGTKYYFKARAYRKVGKKWGSAST